MAKRKKVPAVTADKQKEWLRRNEGGETPPSIAKADGYDVRTVRKQIALAKQERERGEARSQVLRNALEDHYRDLVNFAAKIEGDLRHSRDLKPWLPKDDPLWTALREHLPRSPIWKNLNQWEQSRDAVRDVIEQAVERMIEWLKENGITSFKEQVDIREDELHGFFAARFPYWAEEKPRHPDSVSVEDAGEGMVHVMYDGRYRLFTVSTDRAEEIQRLAEAIQPHAVSLPEMEQIRRLQEQIRNAADIVCEEITVLKLRRVVPGECRYCPI